MKQNVPSPSESPTHSPTPLELAENMPKSSGKSKKLKTVNDITSWEPDIDNETQWEIIAMLLHFIVRVTTASKEFIIALFSNHTGVVQVNFWKNTSSLAQSLDLGATYALTFNNEDANQNQKFPAKGTNPYTIHSPSLVTIFDANVIEDWAGIGVRLTPLDDILEGKLPVGITVHILVKVLSIKEKVGKKSGKPYFDHAVTDGTATFLIKTFDKPLQLPTDKVVLLLGCQVDECNGYYSLTFPVHINDGFVTAFFEQERIEIAASEIVSTFAFVEADYVEVTLRKALQKVRAFRRQLPDEFGIYQHMKCHVRLVKFTNKHRVLWNKKLDDGSTESQFRFEIVFESVEQNERMEVTIWNNLAPHLFREGAEVTTHEYEKMTSAKKAAMFNSLCGEQYLIYMDLYVKENSLNYSIKELMLIEDDVMQEYNNE